VQSRRFRALALLAAGALACPSAVFSQAPLSAGAVFRVFLKSGAALPSYGEAAVVSDRVVFTLLVGATSSRTVLQLISMPAAAIDLDRTRRYVDAVRSAHYAATRGDVDYAAMTQEVNRAVTELSAIADPRKRLEAARTARQKLLDWSAATYGYRAADIRELTQLFDEVIAELGAAAGERQFALDLRADALPATEPLMPVPSLAESIQLALEAAATTDNEDDRLAVLRAAASLADAVPADSPLRQRVARELDLETHAATAYAELAAGVRAEAQAMRKRGDLAGLRRLIDTLKSRDQALGGRRPQMMAALSSELDAIAADVTTHANALERYARMRGALLAYERSIRPVLSGFDGLMPVFLAVRDVRYTAYERLVRATGRLQGFIAALEAVAPPEDLVDIHATMESALKMAEHAIARRRLGSALGSRLIAEEASSAIAGAMLLAEQARGQLVTRLYPPKLKSQ
jgi:hypothetical protein